MKRRIMSILVVLSMVFAMAPAFTLTARAAGSGTEDDPYLIYTYADLAAFRDTVNKGNYGYCGKLMADIEMPTTSWSPIAPTTGYTGTFDGNGHTISGLAISVSSTDNLGLFGVLDGGTITNVALTGASIVNLYTINEVITSSITIPAGYIVGDVGTGSKYDTSTIISYYKLKGYGWTYGKVTAHKTWNSTKHIHYSSGNAYQYWIKLNDQKTETYATGFTDAGALSNTGGLVAVLNSGTVELSSFDGHIDSNYARSGGLVGWQKGGTLERCYSNGSVNGTYSGGAVGVLDGGTVTNCYSTSNVSQYSITETIYDGTGSLSTTPVFSLPAGFAVDSQRWIRGASTGYNYVHTEPTGTEETVHKGYMAGFASSVSSSTTISNAYYYNSSAVDTAFSDNLAQGSRTFVLGSENSGDESNASLDEENFTFFDNFDDWDFRDIWTFRSNLGRPTLYNVAGSESFEKPYAIVPTGDDAVITITADSPTSTVVNLADYIKLTNGKTSAGKFVYRVTDGDRYASVDGNYMTISAYLPKNNYTVTLTGFDPDGLINEFEATFTIRAITYVPVPEVLVGELKYSRSLLLGMIPITTGWAWENEMICPKNDTDEAYPIFYQYEADKAEFYDYSLVTAAGFEVTYDEDRNGVIAKLPVEVAESDESPVYFYITVRNGDTYDLVPDAELECEYDDQFPKGNKTGTEGDHLGQVYAAISKGEHEVTVKADGFTTKTEKITVLKPGTNVPIIDLIPTRTPFVAPVVKDKDTNEVVPEGKVTITKTSDNPTNAWNDGATSITVNAGEDIEGGLPDGKYEIKSSTDGYSHDDITFVEIKDGKPIYYTDKACTVKAKDQEEAAILYATYIDDPMYELTIDKDSENPLKYTATLTIQNVNATYGTFGLRWDTDIFKFDPKTGVHVDTSNIKGGLKLPEQIYGDGTYDASNGYYDFVWSANNSDNSVLEAELDKKTIATFDFTLKDAEAADMITIDTFTICPWTETKTAREWAAKKKADDPNFDPMFWEYWRECDTDNLRNSLKPCRIDAVNSVINDIETGGFFQVAVNGSLGSSHPGDFYDASTKITYNFTITNSVIRFHVTDKYKGNELEGAAVRLFNQTATKLLQSKDTNYLGRANFTVNTAYNPNPDFAYDVHFPGYWPIPASELAKDRPHITTQTGKATEVEVQLEKKIYHDSEIKGYLAQTLDLVKSADLGGERYAYNGRDFHFRIKGAKGFRITKYPTKAYVTIGDDDAGDTKVENLELTPNENGLFTLPAEYLKQDEISVEKMTALGYKDIKEQPDDEGYRSYNIEVQFDQFDVIELEYLVEGMTNANGTVTYKADTPFADGLAPYVPDPYDGEQVNDIKVKTKKSVRDENDKTKILEEANHKTGTFTFEAKPGFKVEKVYINGLKTDIYNDLTKFSYTFGDVDMDCSIVVMFWDGVTPSKDTMLTLVVGDWGYVHVSSPVPEDDIMCTRRTYLNPEANLEFVTDAAKFSDDYELYLVEKEVDGEPRVDITGRRVDGKYTIEPVEGKNVVTYVTFKNKIAEITPTLFVKSYVYTGEGVVNPAGILIYNMYDSVEIDMTADAENSWLVRGAMISPYDNLEDVDEYEFREKKAQNTYRYDSLRESIGIGAVFMEKAYPIQGIVDLSQKSNWTTAAPLRGATIKFVRLVQDEETGEWVEKEKQVPFKTDSTANRTNSIFTTELPKGMWNVYVEKQGYMTYKLTEFEMPEPTNETDVFLFGTPDGKSGTQQKVVPYIGSTETGNSISLTDAKNVKSGMRGNITKTVFDMTDVDNNNIVDYVDLAYVWKNYNERMVAQEYDVFKVSGCPTVKAQ